MQNDLFYIGKLLIIGVGLIGGSLALALRKTSSAGEIVGVGRTESNLKKAIDLGVIDRYSYNLEEEVQDSDMVVIAVPVLAADAIVRKISQSDFGNSVITDVGSTKTSIVQSAVKHFGEKFPNFVAAHPIAGREHSGVEAADPDLFINHHTVLTPNESCAPDTVAKVRKMWETAGSSVSEMNYADHDRILSATSHLPHILAFLLVDYMTKHPDSQMCFDLAAGGFYDFTRVASSDPDMWRDICIANAQNIVEELKGYSDSLANLASKVSGGRSDEIYEILQSAKKARDQRIQK